MSHLNAFDDGSRRRSGQLAQHWRHGAPSLRPHTMMVDLLFCAVMVFAFHMGTLDQNPSGVNTLTAAASDRTETRPVVLRPVSGHGTWRYATIDGRTIAPDEVARVAQTAGAMPVLVVPAHTPLATYLDAEQPLRALGLAVGLAVERGGVGQ